jgi:hypothetical protein
MTRSTRNRTARPRRHALRPRLDALEERTLLSTVSWINPSGGDWDTPSNWTTGALPGPSDDVIINQPGITVTHNGGSDSVNSLTISSSNSALGLSNGSLAFATTSSIAGLLSIVGGTLSTAGTLSVTGSMSWTGGTITGFGSLDIANGATLAMSGSVGQVVTLDGVTLENAGAATLSAQNCCSPALFALALQNGAGIDNQAAGSFRLLNAEAITSDATATFFRNEGA